jgi:hypothetical protein
MFVRKKKTSSGKTQHYLVESRRENGKVRQKVLFYLGEHATAEEALAWLGEEVARLCNHAIELHKQLEGHGVDDKTLLSMWWRGVDTRIHQMGWSGGRSLRSERHIYPAPIADAHLQ